jgi:hypothetical protein
MAAEPEADEEDDDRAEQRKSGYAVAVRADSERVVTTSAREAVSERGLSNP